jgi:DtxR family Mn-dependent transcriptional regulator
MASLTVENYVKSIYLISARQDGDSAPGTTGCRVPAAATGQLAAALDVSPGTVTSMLKTLAESRLATYTPYEGVRLTESGRALALRVLRRHRLIELFLVETRGLSWSEVHEEAEHLEHAVSDRLIDRIDAHLGHPDTDPHGDPIPRSDGTVEATEGRRLAECREGEVFEISRVLDQSPEFLRYLSDSGLQPGVRGTVRNIQSQAGTFTVVIGDLKTTLSREAAEKVLVKWVN